MRLNKKGTTLVELIISIALLSIIMIFMFKLLTDVNNDKVNNDFANENQINRAEIIKTIEEDLKNKIITDVKINNDTINFENTGYSIKLTNNRLEYKGSINKSWTMKNCTISFPKENRDLKKVYEGDTNPKMVAFILNIEIYTSNNNNSSSEYNESTNKLITKNNYIDDITINHYN